MDKIIVAKRRDKQIYREGDNLVKLFSENYSQANILNEALNQSRVQETGLNIPKIKEVTLIEGKRAIVMDYVSGKTMQQLMDENPDKLQEYMDKFVEIQMDIHSKRHYLLTKYADKLTMKILNSELEASTRYDLSLRLADMPRHTSVCHGDYNPSNVIITESGKAYIVDWSHASQGNAVTDVAKTYIILTISGEKERAELYLDTYSKKAGIDKSEIDKWLPLISAAQLKTKPEYKKELMGFINGDCYYD